MNMRLCGACALLALLFVSSLDSLETFETTVQPKKGSNVTVSSKLPDCTVCTVSGVNDSQTSCQASLNLVPEEEVKLQFSCSQPVKESYTVTITSLIECTQDHCNPNTVETQSSLLSEFSRTFIWKVRAPEKTLVSLDVIGEGLDKTEKTCSDGLQYSVVTSQTSNTVPTQYCRGGPETRLELSNEGVVSIEAIPNKQVEALLFQASSGPMKRSMAVTIGPSSTVVLSRDPGEAECEVCVTDGASPQCSSTEKTLKSAGNISLEFRCLKPQDVFTMKMITKIECTQSSCTPAAAEADPNLFKGFKKTLTWDISVPDRTVLALEFPSDGLREISASENCDDGFQYKVIYVRTDGQKKTSYCKGGTVSKLDLLGAKTVTLEVPKGGELDRTVFNLKAAPRRGRTMSVTTDPNTNIIIRKEAKEADCEICVTEGSKQTCKPQQQRLKNPHNTSVEFTCPEPQNVFSVEINREIDCTETSCSGDTVHAENRFFPDFNRTFTWDLKVVSPRAFQLEFPDTGLQQIPNEETCADDHTYSVVTYLRSGPVNIGTFCRGGPVTTILGRYKGRVILNVPGDAKLNPVDFKLNVGPETNMVAIVKVDLPRGTSDTDFRTPNYPGDFPHQEQMQWEFTVPGMHNYTVHFRDHSAPECLNGDVEVTYQKENKKVTKLTVTDPQPKHQQGNFNLVLKNCETNTTLTGLSLSYRVSVMRSGHPILCTVDLTKHQTVSMQIEKVGSDPFCEMSINSVVKEKIEVPKGTTAKLSFLDCPNDDVRLTASQAIECQNVATCNQTSLSVPTLASCLPMPLQSFTWNLSISNKATLDLVSPKGSLRQSLPGEECNQSSSLRLAHSNGHFIGDFCSSGVIQKLQLHANISITALPRDFRRSLQPLLNISISPEITETMIYWVSPKMTSPTILPTPGWPQGMKPFSTVSWVVDLPSQYKSHLQFINVSQPGCAKGHTSISVKLKGQKEELMSRNEEEKVEDLWVEKSFYLNMTNCKPETNLFGATTKIVLQKKTNLLAILLGLFGALVVMIIILTVVCVAFRKKKAKMNKEASIYMGKGNIFRPNDKHFTKTRADNDSHIYTSIDDTLVYGHLLSGSTYNDSMDLPKGPQVDSYQTFTGPTDGPLPVTKEPDPVPDKGPYQTFLNPSDTFLPPRPRTPIDRQDSLGFQDRRMVDNELYTFKGTGDINTIRLSGCDQEPEPPIQEESL